jgi:hypothetical protein
LVREKEKNYGGNACKRRGAFICNAYVLGRVELFSVTLHAYAEATGPYSIGPDFDLMDVITPRSERVTSGIGE